MPDIDTSRSDSLRFDWFRNVGAVCKKEWSIYCADRVQILLTIVIPPLLFTLFCLIYNTGMVTDLPIAICDNDQSGLSHSLARAIESSSTLRVVECVENPTEMENEMRRGRICGGFYFPSGMERDIKKGATAHPVLYKNAQNILVGNYLSKEGLSILRTFNAGVLIKKLKMKGLAEEQAMALVNPVATDVSVLYNPNFNYTGFLCPGLIFAQFQVIVMLSALLIMTRACERHELQCFPGGTPCTPGALLIGKTLPYFALHCLTGMGILLILFPVFDVRLPGSFGLTCGLMMVYIAASFVPGLIIGLIVPNSIFGAQVGILINMPAFIFSGYTFPLSAIPTPLAHLSQILPFTHFVPAFFKLAVTRAPIAAASAEITALMAFVVPTLLLVYGLIRHESRKESVISIISPEGM